MSRAGIDGAAGSLPVWQSGGQVYRDATDAKNITYTVYPGVWHPGSAWPSSATYNYDFWKLFDLVSTQLQNSTNPTLNVAGDPADTVYICYLTVTSGAGSGSKTFGYFGNAYPSANPWVLSL
jgi:hypothetical protein